jgi:uncharacterized protein (TIGR03435 family)
MRQSAKVLWAAASIIMVGTPLVSQTRPAQQRQFEVDSVKRNTGRPSSPDDVKLGCNGTDSHGPGTNIPLGRCAARFQSLRLVIALAFDIPPSLMYPYEGKEKILSGPEWMDSEIYDIDAKAEMPATQAELKLMLQQLLVDRFSLKFHREKRELSVYALVATRNGIKFRPAPKDRDCGGQLRRDHQFELGARSLAGQCHGFVPENGALTGQSVSMSDLAEMLSIWAGRIVIDKTGSNELYDIKMPRLTGNAVPVGPVGDKRIENGAPAPPPPPAEARILGDAPQTVFTALEQFGLKLESTKGPVDVLVIDSIERPAVN